VSQELGSLGDLMATVAALIGTELPPGAGEDSFNLLPAFLEQNKAPIRDSIILHSIDGKFSVRQGNWKLEEGLGSGGFSPPRTVPPAEGGPKGQLYDLASDPAELHNLYQGRPDMVDKLATLEQYRRQGYTRAQ
jgi:arylsulfatase A